MFFFKSLFVRVHELLMPLLSLWSLWQILQGQWLWLAVLLAWAPLFLINLWRRYLGNIAFHDERESLALAPALVGVALLLMAGERDQLLWWTLAGLFSLLLSTVVMSCLPRGVRESRGDESQLAQLKFHSGSGQLASPAQVRLLMFIHSGWSPYAVMVLRELQTFLQEEALPADQVALVFSDAVPSHNTVIKELQAMGVHLWWDDGDSSRSLGLWLRGGSAGRFGGRNALRPALALMPQSAEVNQSAAPQFWLTSDNVRLPPSPRQHRQRLLSLLSTD